MNMSIEKMLSHVYEIEGLMLVSRRLGEENTPDVITNKMYRKVRELAEMCGMTMQPADAPEEPTAPVPPAAPAPAESSKPSEPSENSEKIEPLERPVAHLPEEDYDADETWQHDNGEEFKEVFSLDFEEPEKAEDPAPAAPVDEAAPAAPKMVVPPVFHVPEEDAVVAEPKEEPKEETMAAPKEEPVTVPNEAPVEEPMPEPDPAVVPVADEEPDITVEFIEAYDDYLPEPEDEMPQPPVPTEFPTLDEEPAPLRVDEKLQRSMSKDIRKAFSLNDRFRFQRELFAGSASAMNTAIEHIEMMSSYGNAELYFFSQLHWDRDNEDVKDFMAIVRNHYQQ
jgi:hypothetical protein